MMSMIATKKRKDVHGGFNYEFFDFPLPSPALKSRRLAMEQLPPIVEEDQAIDGVMEAQDVEEEEVEESSRNEERAVILYKPFSLHYSPSTFSLSVDSDFVSGFKSKLPWSNDTGYTDRLADKAAEQHDGAGQCRAVVPWVSSPVRLAENVDVSRADTAEADVVGEASMDIEDENIGNANSNTDGLILGGGIEALHPWQQQHCMIPRQFPQSNPHRSHGSSDGIF